MGRFFFWTVVFLIAGGFLLHYQINIPWISSWLGQLPGDFSVRKEEIVIYFPVTSSALVSLFFSFLISLIFRN